MTQTIRDLALSLFPRVWKKAAPSWPPDAFAAAASLLQRSGGYVRVVSDWPPGRNPENWAARTAKVGRRWRASATRAGAPKEVQAWWDVVRGSAATPVDGIGKESGDPTCEALLQILACADEASAGLGVSPSAQPDDFESLALRALVNERATLCRDIDSSMVCVLPKMHTPQHGITLRSLSHHLALIPVRDVFPKWNTPAFSGRAKTALNLLVVPWPFHIAPSSFHVSDAPRELRNMDPGFGFFSVRRPSKEAELERLLRAMIAEAEDLCGSVEGLVFPELSLSEAEFLVASSIADEKSLVVVAGVAGERRNRSVFLVPTGAGQQRFEQDKHHRWLLDGGQVATYGLGTRLDPSVAWWEDHRPHPQRTIEFVNLSPMLTATVLICEDLARQDPVAEIVRTVGPNLVFALLMDGPQLQTRWPGRYASVLADDPGSSVLSVTSLGMAALSKPPDKPISRVVALWKDSASGVTEIDLPKDADAAVLCIAVAGKREWSADGRHDGGATGLPRLVGIHPIRLKDDKNTGARGTNGQSNPATILDSRPAGEAAELARRGAEATAAGAPTAAARRSGGGARPKKASQRQR